ncbi:Hypothetical protein A7982_04207 [Minicystis rosea]|nr:Hypothetical protein A7982_04207 [Minicystis rosea]
MAPPEPQSTTRAITVTLWDRSASHLAATTTVKDSGDEIR